MSYNMSVKVTGIDELAAALDALPAALAEAAAKEAIKAAADVVAGQAKSNALAIKDTGLLAESITVKMNAKQLITYTGRKRIHHKGQRIISAVVGSKSLRRRVYRLRKDTPTESTKYSGAFSTTRSSLRSAIRARRMRREDRAKLNQIAARPRKGVKKISTLHAEAAEANFQGPRQPGYWQWTDPRRYAHLVELGTARTPMRPFLRPAIESKGEAAVGAIASVLRTKLPEAVRKAAMQSVTGGFKK